MVYLITKKLQILNFFILLTCFDMSFYSFIVLYLCSISYFIYASLYQLNGVWKMSNYKKWIKAAGIRAIKTIAQTAIATIGTEIVMSEVNWNIVLSTSLLAGILSLLTSLAGLPEIKK